MLCYAAVIAVTLATMSKKVHVETEHSSHSPSASERPHWRFNFPAASGNFTRGGARWVIVVSLWTLLVSLSACTSHSAVEVGNGSPTATSFATATMTSVRSPSAQTTRASGLGGVTATIIIQGKRLGFESDCGCGDNGPGVIIDPSQWVQVATDGSGEVSGYLKSFDYTPPSTGPLSAGLPAPSQANGSQTTYYVPSDCATHLDTARTTAFTGLHNQIDAYREATGLDAQLMLGEPPLLEYPVIYDTAHITCSPTAGYQQATPFYYMVSMPAHITLPFFKVSSVIAFRKQEAIAHTPASFEFEDIDSACGMSYAQKVSATVIDYRCDVGGYYRWKWTPSIARTLAAQIAGKDLATARDILAAYPGDVISPGQGISIQLSSGSSLPSDPSQIRFKVYDTVLVGANSVQTTGTPQIVP